MLNWLCVLLGMLFKNKQYISPLLFDYATLYLILSLIPTISSVIFSMFLLINQDKTIFHKKSKIVLALNAAYLVVFLRISWWIIK